jgi:hypothetical protein
MQKIVYRILLYLSVALLIWIAVGMPFFHI